MMVGYPKDHTGDCYCMWDKSTGGVHVTHDVTWLQRMYFPADPNAGNYEVICKEDFAPRAANVSAGERDELNGIETGRDEDDAENTNTEHAKARNDRNNNATPMMKECDMLSRYNSVTANWRQEGTPSASMVTINPMVFDSEHLAENRQPVCTLLRKPDLSGNPSWPFASLSKSSG